MEALSKAGVKTVILAVNYKPDEMRKILKPWEAKLGVEIQYSQEHEPLDTAGPIGLAKDKILAGGDDDEPFFVLNSDITADYPFKELYDFHKAHGGEGTIMVTKVAEPSKYGVVMYDKQTGKIEKFVEKPQVFVGNKINAGIYIFSKSILKRIQPVPTSIERKVFPELANEGQLYCKELLGFWMDVGQPKDFLSGMCLFLNSLRVKEPTALTTGEGTVGPCLIHPSAKIGKGCLIGPYVCIGPDVVIEDGVRIKRTTVLGGATIKSNSMVDNSIIGWDSIVGRWVRIENVSVLGRAVKINDMLLLNGGKVLDHKTLKASVPSPSIIM
eukprot:CAMPEP_0168535938 /NCGR_PEP_ID=MMETSP0405-20121227/19144_1 /TAXON_ID=498012 /ORGANISM="Trichosphaerium sp, Strain Am-I-7 wt" /LENGTH=326 /DNA_ID=CAMNT_0008563633 /DNA_START=59 /DNA_END=1039 /DNA_ORIENTATION=-